MNIIPFYFFGFYEIELFNNNYVFYKYDIVYIIILMNIIPF